MARTVVVRGRPNDPGHVDLDEPVSGIRGAVEETLRPMVDSAVGSPAAVLHAMRALPRLESGDVDELERMIEEGKLPTGPEDMFDAFSDLMRKDLVSKRVWQRAIRTTK